MSATLNNLHSFLASGLRGLRGFAVTAYNQENPPRPAQRLELYEFEACPFCRKVREVLSELDLAYVARTCPKGDQRKRAAVMERGGQAQFPYLVDPNTGRELYESEAIIDYLCEQYGEGRGALGKALSPLNTMTAAVASAVRPRGGRSRAGLEAREQPAELLELYNFEISPFCRKVRETLCELNLDYVVHNVAKKSRRRPELVERGGKMMVPFLIDPNTGREMYESEDIIAYLEATYGPRR